MTSLVTKYAAKKLLGKQMDKYKEKKPVGDDDPFFTYVKNPRNGKMKKVKKQIPDYIPEHDAVILAKMRQRAYWLDVSLFNIAGVRFGWSSVIGLIPAAGDAVDAGMALLLVMRCNQIDGKLPSNIYIQMMINVFFDFVIGLVPFIGDLIDAMFRANTRNLALLEKHLDDKYKPKEQKEIDKQKRASGMFVPPATVTEEFSDDEDKFLPRHNQDVEPQRPEPARYAEETRGGDRSDPRRSNTKKSNKLSSGSRREQRPVGQAEYEYRQPSRDDTQGTHTSTRH